MLCLLSESMWCLFETAIAAGSPPQLMNGERDWDVGEAHNQMQNSGTDVKKASTFFSRTCTHSTVG